MPFSFTPSWFAKRIQNVFTAVGVRPGHSGPYTCTLRARTVIYIYIYIYIYYIYIWRNNTYHRTHKIESNKYLTIQQNKKDNNNLNGST
jgi:hypothetical protein